MEKPEDFIFPARPFDAKRELNNKEDIIQIPTGRKTKDNQEETIPCLFKKTPNSNKLLIFFHCNGGDMFNAYYLLTKNGIDVSSIIDEEKFDDFFELIKQHIEIIEPVDYLLLDEAQDSTETEFQFIWCFVGPLSPKPHCIKYAVRFWGKRRLHHLG